MLHVKLRYLNKNSITLTDFNTAYIAINEVVLYNYM